MVLNHSSTPTKLQQVQKPAQTFDQNANQTEVKINKETGSKANDAFMCFHCLKMEKFADAMIFTWITLDYKSCIYIK